jgi:hypothetical protein
VLAVNCILQNDVCNSTPSVQNVGVIPQILEVLSKADLVLLHKFIHRWINNRDYHQNGKNSFFLKPIVNINFIDINHHKNYIGLMSYVTNQMRFISMRVPFEGNQVLNTFALEDVKLVAFVEDLKKV